MAPRALQQKALELYQRGYSYREIGQVIRKSRTTVYYYLKQIRVTVK
ncbi:helix-turn-helix domain-containing protein [Chitinophaga polysaccharea]